MATPNDYEIAMSRYGELADTGTTTTYYIDDSSGSSKRAYKTGALEYTTESGERYIETRIGLIKAEDVAKGIYYTGRDGVVTSAYTRQPGPTTTTTTEITTVGGEPATRVGNKVWRTESGKEYIDTKFGLISRQEMAAGPIYVKGDASGNVQLYRISQQQQQSQASPYERAESAVASRISPYLPTASRIPDPVSALWESARGPVIRPAVDFGARTIASIFVGDRAYKQLPPDKQRVYSAGLDDLLISPRESIVRDISERPLTAAVSYGIGFVGAGVGSKLSSGYRTAVTAGKITGRVKTGLDVAGKAAPYVIGGVWAADVGTRAYSQPDVVSSARAIRSAVVVEAAPAAFGAFSYAPVAARIKYDVASGPKVFADTTGSIGPQRQKTIQTIDLTPVVDLTPTIDLTKTPIKLEVDPVTRGLENKYYAGTIQRIIGEMRFNSLPSYTPPSFGKTVGKLKDVLPESAFAPVTPKIDVPVTRVSVVQPKIQTTMGLMRVMSQEAVSVAGRNFVRVKTISGFVPDRVSMVLPVVTPKIDLSITGVQQAVGVNQHLDSVLLAVPVSVTRSASAYRTRESSKNTMVVPVSVSIAKTTTRSVTEQIPKVVTETKTDMVTDRPLIITPVWGVTVARGGRVVPPKIVEPSLTKGLSMRQPSFTSFGGSGIFGRAPKSRYKYKFREIVGLKPIKLPKGAKKSKKDPFGWLI